MNKPKSKANKLKRPTTVGSGVLLGGWSTFRPKKPGFFWFKAIWRNDKTEAHEPVVTEIGEDDWNKNMVSKLDGEYFGMNGRGVIRFWSGPLNPPNGKLTDRP